MNKDESELSMFDLYHSSVFWNIASKVTELTIKSSTSVWKWN